MENTTKIIKIIHSHLNILNAQLIATKARWDINEANEAHDEITGTCIAWDKEDRDNEYHKENKIEDKILTLKKLLWDLESVGIDTTENLQS